ncbi:TPA: phage tail protein, partial [Escherichia coli]
VNRAGNAVQKNGDTLSGGLTFENDSILAWIRNTDWAKIGFKNDADGDTDSYMWFETGDNGNEYFKWRSRQGTTTKDLMNLKWDALYVTGDIFANRFAINSSTGMWIQMRDQNVIRGRNAVSTDGAQALLRQDHADRKFMIGGLGNRQFGIYMINNSRTENGTDGQAYMDNNGNWLCGSQIIPGNYGNFDSRYVRDVRLGTRVVQTMQKGVMYEKSGHAITGLGIIGAVDGDDPAVFRPIQKYINGTWYNVAQV